MAQQRTWQDNADEFAALDKGEGWPFARLVACSVAKGRGEGGSHHRNDRYGGDGKTSAQEFARRAETSAPRVLRFLEAWGKAAEKGWVPAADTLTPDSVRGMADPEHPWNGVYDASKAGGRPRDTQPEDAAAILSRRGAKAVVESLTPEQQQELASAITAVNRPAVEEALEPGLTETTKMMRRMDKERDAWDESTNRGQARGGEHEIKAMLEIQWLNENGHRDSLERLLAIIQGLLDLQQAEDLTPEMFHE
jgi:predicted NBD/HSP70 family sugar kinase